MSKEGSRQTRKVKEPGQLRQVRGLWFESERVTAVNGQREPAYHLHADDGFVSHLGDGDGSQRGGTKAQDTAVGRSKHR